jgi:hypothetical protein
MSDINKLLGSEEPPIGVLFDSINYYKIEDLDKFITELNNEQALYCLIQACQSAYKRNAFTLTETEVLSKALRKISFNSPTTQIEEE